MNGQLADSQNGADSRHDVAVIGGGPAGLSGALVLGRARRSVLVVDDGQPRNAPAEGVHGYLGHEGTPPAELLATGRAEAGRYGARFRTGTVTDAVREDPHGFRLTLADGGTVRARRLLVTSGLTDELPDVPGLAGLWGRDVLHCPYCHGWEVRGQPIGILGTGPLAVHQALMWRQWSERVTLFLHTGPEPDDEQGEQLAARGITVAAGEVTGVDTDGDGRLSGVRLASPAPDGSGGRQETAVLPCRALAVATGLTARAGFLASLGLVPQPQEVNGTVIGSRIPADATGLTEVPGVWAAGNAAQVTEQVIGAAAAGVRAAAAINADLTAEETRLAVAEWRAGRRATGLTEVPGVWAAGNAAQVTEQVIGAAAAGVRAAAAINADLTAEETRLAVAEWRAGRRLPVP
ncbi:NAD(P)/FAD-dependent oxidoreductase [Streptomyces sp. YIM 98790]|uniref:NAD(P)/FAD-dependent oxidoreductase n=1 Tax=Streptomyces sp. YIM 98790 TaxID=2689077 RepID=UPI00140A98E2|nr:NAD(P)/FAD-dependent oxidoreductase [Streptomyces sp. YIM 98790]